MVAAMMIVLPLLYLALVSGLGAVIVFFAVDQFPESLYSPSTLIYLGGLMSGVTVCAFLLKPLFVEEEQVSTAVELKPGEQERLDQLLAQVCAIVGAPMPSRIAVDCAVNASVSFRRGMRSLLKGELTLLIGLPLVRSLDARSFAGVIAHEMGHFSQGAGIRLTYIIRRLNGWFYKAVYHRDGWDRWIQQRARTSRLGLLFQVAQCGIWCSRKILSVLMLVGQAVSCFVLRRMEFDADYYEICVSGTDGFRETTERIALLHEAASAARLVVDDGLAAGELVDDLPLFISRMAGMVSTSAQARIAKRMASSGGGFLDTHPTDWDRIGRALEMRKPGIVLRPNLAAGEFFEALDELSNRVTRRHFSVAQECEMTWVSAEKLAARVEKIQGLEAAADRLSGCRIELWDSSIRAVPSPIGKAVDRATLEKSLRGVTRAFNASAVRCTNVSRKINMLDEQYSASLKGKELMLAGYSLNKNAKGRVAGGLAKRKELEELREELADFQMLASKRLGLVLELKGSIPGSATENEEQRAELGAALSFLEVSYRLQTTLTRLRELLLRQTILIQHMEPSREDSYEFRSRVQANAAHVRIAHRDLLTAFEGIKDPLAPEDKSVAEWLRSTLPPAALSPDPVFRSYQQASDALQRLGQRHRQALGMVAIAVFEMEESL